MAKDREGAYHPPKGKPSGSTREEENKTQETDSTSLKHYEVIADKYTRGENEEPANVRMRHPNRNVDKSEQRRSEKSQGRGSKTMVKGLSVDSGTIAEELPDVLSKQVFERLSNFRGDLCISVYLPTHPSGVEVNEQEDNIVFKNCLQKATGILKSREVDQVRIQSILEPAYKLLRNEPFWKSLDRGLAVFIGDGLFKFVKMTETPTLELLINNTFLVKPLVNAMTVKEHFYLLVISKKRARFYKANAFGMEPIQVDELPNGIEDVVHLEEKGDQRLFRTESGQAGKGGAFHGHGAGKPDEKENISLYLQEVDNTLWQEMLHRESVPLLLGGVEYLLAIYKSVSRYKNIWNDVLTGNHEYDDINSLYQQARKVMSPYFEERTKKALMQFGNQSATPLTSTDASEIISAAHYGRVWHLFLIKDSHLWGTFNDMDDQLTMHDERQEGDECLVDRTVIKTILTGGDVHFVKIQDMPGGGIMAALMRY